MNDCQAERVPVADMDPGPRVVRRVEAGSGLPAVVLEAGLNNGAASWDRVMPLLAPHVRVIAYNRAGLGGSDPAPGMVTIERQIEDLASLITGLGAGPCVLAGHSWGGVLVQLLAFRRPELAAGLVLVDPGQRWLTLADTDTGLQSRIDLSLG
jgi:pimeloyl-ACP methyl ester carboxylesterase